MSLIGEVVETAVPPLRGFKLALKLAPYVVLALLLVAFLWQRNSLTKAESERETYKTEAEQSAGIIKGFAEQRIDNEAIAEAVAKKLSANGKRTESIRRNLKEAQNEPNVRDWAVVPVPDSVRRALAPEGTEPAP